MIGLIDSWDVEYNGTENEALFKLVCDSAAELSSLTQYDSIKIRIGSECTDIATGDKYLKSSSSWVLQPSVNAWENVYTKAQVDSMYNSLYQTMLYYHTVQESNDGTIAFYAFAGVVGSLTIYGNGQQPGTPTPAAPIMPDFVGTLSGSDWTIPVTCAGQTVPVYLGQTQTVRKIQKLVFNGTEEWQFFSDAVGTWQFYINNISLGGVPTSSCVSNIAPYGATASNRQRYDYGCYLVTGGNGMAFQMKGAKDTFVDIASWESYLAAQYAAGTPVTVWYVLAEPTTGIVNEPLYKIGDNCDVLSLTSTTVSIPITDGENTLSIDTDLSPSKIEISGTVRD